MAEGTDGDVEFRKVQSQGRVDIPDDMLDDADIGVGETVMVLIDGEEIRVRSPASDLE